MFLRIMITKSLPDAIPSNLHPNLLTFEVISPAAPCAPRGQAVVLRRWQRIKDAVANGASDVDSYILHIG